MQAAVNPAEYLISPPSHTGQSILNSFIFNSSPQRASSHAHGALLWVDDHIVEIAREVDYEAVFGGSCPTGAVATAANRNLEAVLSSVFQGERNVVVFFYEGNNTSFALRIGGPASY